MSTVTLYGSIVIAAVAVLQSTLFQFIEIANVAPDLVLLIVIFVANKNGRMAGQVTGFVAGVVLDSMGLAPLGFYALLYTLIGALVGVSRGKMFVDPIFVPVVLAAVSMLAKGLLGLLVAALFSIEPLRGQVFTSRFFIEIVYTGLLSPLVFGLLGMASWLQPDQRRGEII